MFFLASKLLEFLLMPTVWVALLLAVGLWRNRRGWYWAALGLFLFFANEAVVNYVMIRWEVPVTRVRTLKREYPCAVVLGGFTETHRYPNDRTYLNDAGDRMIHSIMLHRRRKAKMLLITGGNGSLLDMREPEAANAARLAVDCAIPGEDLVLEPKARNTRENALFAKHLLDSLQVTDTVLLVTSAFHARRAAACFDKVGVTYRIFTTDPRSMTPRFTPDVLLLPTPGAMGKWSMLIHEWLGYAMYKVAGYV